MTSSIKNGDMNSHKIGFNVFYVILKGVPIIAGFKRPISEVFN